MTRRTLNRRFVLDREPGSLRRQRGLTVTSSPGCSDPRSTCSTHASDPNGRQFREGHDFHGELGKKRSSPLPVPGYGVCTRVLCPSSAAFPPQPLMTFLPGRILEKRRNDFAVRRQKRMNSTIEFPVPRNKTRVARLARRVTEHPGRGRQEVGVVCPSSGAGMIARLPARYGHRIALASYCSPGEGRKGTSGSQAFTTSTRRVALRPSVLRWGGPDARNREGIRLEYRAPNRAMGRRGADPTVRTNALWTSSATSV